MGGWAPHTPIPDERALRAARTHPPPPVFFLGGGAAPTPPLLLALKGHWAIEGSCPAGVGASALRGSAGFRLSPE